MNKKMLNSKLLSLMLAGASLPLGALAQGLTVSGHVQDTTGESVAYATVTVPGSKTMTLTDANGNFKLNVKPGATLRVTYIGYKTATVKADGTVVITLEDNSMLNEAVVIGYGTAKKNDLTGSVTAIKPDDKNHGLQTSAQDMIQGKVAGVNVVSSSGAPGGAATIRIRGGSSLNAKNDPLIVIDGLALDNDGLEGSPNALTLVNPNDIESFTVLKDASATAIYGSRASNGVIIITTKKGRKNTRPHVSYNGNVSVSTNTKYLDVLNAQEFIDLVRRRTGLTDDAAWQASEYYNSLGYWNAAGQHLFADTDWQKEIYRTAVSTDHNITLSGGIKNMPYRVSFGYTNQRVRSRRQTIAVTRVASIFRPPSCMITCRLTSMVSSCIHAHHMLTPMPSVRHWAWILPSPFMMIALRQRSMVASGNGLLRQTLATANGHIPATARLSVTL